MPDDVETLVGYVRQQLGDEWARRPNGWTDDIEPALIDAVLSIRARYGSPTTGVRAAVERWRIHRGSGRCDDLDVLAATAPESLGEILRNRQRTGGQTKAAAIADAARRLTAAGVRHARDLDPLSVEHRRAYVSVHGLGQITWQYLLMRLGHSHVKPDTWVMRFVTTGLAAQCGAGTRPSCCTRPLSP